MTPKNKRRNSYLKLKYGITLADYNKLLKKQGGGCALCLKTPEEEGRNLAVDHDHKSGQIRGILCMFCNHRVIGRHSNALLFAAAARYLTGPFTGWFVPKKVKKRKRK